MKTVILIMCGFGMLLAPKLDAKIVPSDGLWQTYDDPAIGSGVNIRTQGDITMVTVFTYREDGSPVWYFATGEVDDNGVFRAALGETKNGEFIFENSPQSAEIVDPGKTIELVFNSTEIGTLSINDSEPKPIHTYRFGVYTHETEQLTTPLGDFYQFPDLTGQWVLGNATDEISFTFDFLSDYGASISPPDPNFHFFYDNQFPSENNFYLSLLCPTWHVDDIPFCHFSAKSNHPSDDDQADLLNRMYVFLDDVGVNTMTFHLQPDGDDSYTREHPVYQAFRLDDKYEENADLDPRIFPVEGHWRTADDPAVGSGINFHSQGDIIMMTVFTYDEDGLPIWYMATGELGYQGGLETHMISTQGGTPIEATHPVSAEVNQIKYVAMDIYGNQVVRLYVEGQSGKDVFNYNFGYPEFQASERQQNSSDPLKIATPSGWWLMAEENAANSMLLHLVKNTNKLSPPIPTDWVYFENKADSSDVIKGINCPTDYAYQWAYCYVVKADENDGFNWYLPMERMGVTSWWLGYEDNNNQSTGYYMLHRINPPMQP
jgi:hypothetical protein